MGNSSVSKKCDSCGWTTTKLDLERCKRCRRASNWIVKKNRPKSVESTTSSKRQKSDATLTGESSTGSMWNLLVPNSFGNSRMFQVGRINTPKNAAVRSPDGRSTPSKNRSRDDVFEVDGVIMPPDTPPPLHESPSPPQKPEIGPPGLPKGRRISGSGSNSTTTRRNSKRRNSRRKSKLARHVNGASRNYLAQASRLDPRMPKLPSSIVDKQPQLQSSDSSLTTMSSEETCLPVGLQPKTRRNKKKTLTHKESADYVHGKFFKTESSFGGGKDDAMRQDESVESLKHTTMGRDVFKSVTSSEKMNQHQHTLGRHHHLHRAALSVNSIMRQWQHRDKLIARAWHTWVSKYRAYKAHEQFRNNLKEQFLPPPNAVTSLIKGTCDYHNDELMKKLIREACDWVIRALGVSYISNDVQYVERELLGIERFTTNLDWANCWDHFREELKKMMVELGSELKVFYEEQDLAIILGSWNPLGLSSTTSSFLLKPGEKNELSIHIEPSKNAIDAETSLPPGLPIVVSPVKSAEKKYRNHHDQGFKNGEKATQRLSLDSLPPPPDEDLAPITPSSPPPLPPKNVNKQQPRQDRAGCVPLPPNMSFDTLFDECCYIHFLRLIATAIDRDFQHDVNRCLGVRIEEVEEDEAHHHHHHHHHKKGHSPLLTDGETFHRGIKGFERMFTKMLSRSDHRMKPRPRPANNVDINRCLAVTDDAQRLVVVLQKLRTRFGSFVKFKNGMMLSDEEASKVFHLRLILVSVLYKDSKFKNFGEMCRDPRVKKLWRSYEESEAPLSIAPESWRRQIRVALSWLHSSELSQKPVRMVCEVQCMLRTYRDVRFRMHEVYKAHRAADQSSLYHDFLRYAVQCRRDREFVRDGKTHIRRAARDGDLKALSQCLIRGKHVVKQSEIMKTFHVACKYSQIDVVKRLMKSNRVQAKDLSGSFGVHAVLSALSDPYRSQQVSHSGQSACKEIISMIMKGHYIEDGDNDDVDDYDADMIRSIDKSSALHIAVQNGRLRVVKLFLNLGFDPNRLCDSKGTPLVCAAMMGHAEIAKILIESGAKTCLSYTKNGTTPLVVASQNGHVEVVNVLLNIGKANPNEISTTMKPLYIASVKGHVEIVRALLDSGANVDEKHDGTTTPLFVASHNGFTEVVSSLVKRGRANVNLRCGKHKTTPLGIATRQSYLDVIEILLKAGADISEADDDGATPLHIAAENGDYDIVNTLLKYDRKHGCVNQMKNKGASALYVAAQNGHDEICRKLLAVGADVDMSRDDGCSPLYIAAKNGHVETIKVLVKAHARIEQSSDKINPLYVAAQNGFKEVVRILLDCVETYHHDDDDMDVLPHSTLPPGMQRRARRGRRQRKKSNDLIRDHDRRSRRRSVVSVAAAVGNNDIVKMLLRSGAEVNLNQDGSEEDIIHPLFVASKKGNVDIVKSILDAGANVNVRREKDGQTALFMTVRKGFLKVAEILLKAGADANTSNHEGHTPLCIAARAGREDIVRALLSHGADIHRSKGLIHASRHGHVEIVKLFLSKWKRNKRNDDAMISSACAHAKQHNQSEVLRVLMEFREGVESS